jgi:hypothetical protein
MDCPRIRELLSQYIDDALDGPTKKTVREHLSLCKACQAELTSLKTLVGELRSLEPIKAPDDFLEGVRERISPASRSYRLLKRLFFPLRIKIPMELAAAAAVAALVVLVFSMQKGVIKPSAPPVVTEYKHSAEEPPRKEVETKPGLLSAPRQAPVEVESDEAPKEKGPIELVLLIGKKTSKRAYPKESHARMKLSQREIQKDLEKKVDYGASLQADVSRMQEPKAEVTPELPEVQRIKDLIARLDGNIVEEVFDEASGRLTSILASLPATQLHPFYREVSQLAAIQETTPLPDIEKDRNVHFLITFTSSN